MQVALERLDAIRAFLSFNFSFREKKGTTPPPPIEITATSPPAEDGVIFVNGPTVSVETEKIIEMCDKTG